VDRRNELNHSYTNPRVFDAVNDVAKMIHELDPNHPVTTALEAFKPGAVADALARAPELDFLSFQLYGNLFTLAERIQSAGFTKPFMVTEWGTIGYWEMEKTPWRAPVELTSSEKATSSCADGARCSPRSRASCSARTSSSGAGSRSARRRGSGWCSRAAS